MDKDFAIFFFKFFSLIAKEQPLIKNKKTKLKNFLTKA